MALRAYWRLLQRYRWLILLLPLLVGAFSLLTYEEAPVHYETMLRYSVSFMPVPREQMDQDPRLGAVQASEYVVDDLTVIYLSSRFASFVQQYLPEPLDPTAITEATHVEKTHRLITLTLSAPTETGAAQLATAVQQATENDLQPLLSQLWDVQGMRMELVHDSGVHAVGDDLRARLELPLRVALALGAAIALAFALDFLDDSVRSRSEAEGLAGPVLGEIPVEP